jgi:hypothetical protein
MATVSKKYIGKSNIYKGVYKYINTSNNLSYTGVICGAKKQGFDNERDCALWVDKKLISKGKDPVNILVKK